jgi:hypothetical protein
LRTRCWPSAHPHARRTQKSVGARRGRLNGSQVHNSRTKDGDYILRAPGEDGPFDEGKLYADAVAENWIASIGEHWDTGEIRASLLDDYYGAREWKCLWLR